MAMFAALAAIFTKQPTLITTLLAICFVGYCVVRVWWKGIKLSLAAFAAVLIGGAVLGRV